VNGGRSAPRLLAQHVCAARTRSRATGTRRRDAQPVPLISAGALAFRRRGRSVGSVSREAVRALARSASAGPRGRGPPSRRMADHDDRRSSSVSVRLALMPDAPSCPKAACAYRRPWCSLNLEVTDGRGVGPPRRARGPATGGRAAQRGVRAVRPLTALTAGCSLIDIGADTPTAVDVSALGGSRRSLREARPRWVYGLDVLPGAMPLLAIQASSARGWSPRPWCASRSDLGQGQAAGPG
jgi:hypothetical protein